MKRILVVNKSFDLGGIQSSLNNMLRVIAKDNQVDLLVFNNSGKLKKFLPENVNLIKPSRLVRTMGMSVGGAIKSKDPVCILFKVFSAVWSKIFSNRLPIFIALSFQKKITGYDIAVAYHHEGSKKAMVNGFCRFVIKCTDAPVKIGWIHADFEKVGLGTENNRKVYSKMDKIVGVSKACIGSFVRCFPELEGKCTYAYNVLSAEEIIEKSNRENNVFEAKEREKIFFSASRLVEEKGIERAIDAMLPLWSEGYSFKWYIAGSGGKEADIKRKIKENNLDDKVILLGYQENPYPFIKEADWFFVGSFHETFSMVAAEAGVLGTPVIATDIPVMRELVGADNGILCSNSEEGIREGIKKALSMDKDAFAPCKNSKNAIDALLNIFE